MSAPTLTRTRFQNGVWEGLLVAGDTAGPPEISASFEDRPVAGVVVSETTEPGRWVVEVPLPARALREGVQTLLIRDARTDTVLQSFALLAGETLAEDIRAEVSLLRAELDLLKRAFRRHCRETGGT